MIRTWCRIVLTYENIEKFILLIKLLWFNKKKNTSSQFSYWMYFICHNRFVLLVLSCTLLNPATCFLGWVKSFKIRKATETGNGVAQVFRKFNSVLNVHFFLKSRMVCGILLLLLCDGCRYKIGISQTKWSVLIGKMMHSFKECYCHDIYVEI